MDITRRHDLFTEFRHNFDRRRKKRLDFFETVSCISERYFQRNFHFFSGKDDQRAAFCGSQQGTTKEFRRRGSGFEFQQNHVVSIQIPLCILWDQRKVNGETILVCRIAENSGRAPLKIFLIRHDEHPMKFFFDIRHEDRIGKIGIHRRIFPYFRIGFCSVPNAEPPDFAGKGRRDFEYMERNPQSNGFVPAFQFQCGNFARTFPAVGKNSVRELSV